MNLQLLGLVLRIVTSIKDVIQHGINFRRTREVKKEYRQGKRHVKRGEVDKINEILRGLIPFLALNWML